MAKRLFVAIELPESVMTGLAAIARDLTGARWVKPEHLHLTVRFVGDTEDFLYLAIREKLSEVQCAPFELELAGIGFFPPRGAPRVVWAGINQLAGLGNLYRQVEASLVAAGIAPETRPLRPHVTIARLSNPSIHDVAAYVKRNSNFRAGPFPVESFNLFSSVLTQRGPIHTIEASYPLISSSP